MKPHAYSFSTSRYAEPNTFGQSIRKARLEKGMRQKDLAKLVGVDEMTIVNWERYPTVPMRTHRKVESLCDLLPVEWSELKRRFPHTELALSAM